VLEAHRRFVRDRFGLDAATFVPFGDGWASYTYLADDAWVFQFPRRPAAEEVLRKQIVVRRRLAELVGALVPAPTHVSIDPLCMGYRKIEGAPFTEAPDGAWPDALGRFLRAVHAAPPAAVGFDERNAEDVAGEIDRWRATVVPLLDADDRRRAGDLFDAVVADMGFAPCVIHADVGAEHILVDGRGDLAGVIDWGACAVGDAAKDFAWLLEARPALGERILHAYGGAPDPGFRARARRAFALMPWHEVTYGLDTGQPAFVASGLAGVRARLP